LFAAMLIAAPSKLVASTLFYSGDADQINSYANQNNAQDAQTLYNNFTVTAPHGWGVTSLFENTTFLNLPAASIPAATNATWAIFSNADDTTPVTGGGILVASGDSRASIVANGQTINIPGEGISNLPEYSVTVSGLNVHLAPGNYWMTVYPDNTNGGLAGNEETQGLHGVNLPASPNLFNTGPTFTSPPTAHQFIDPANANPQNPGLATSMGVGGFIVPEPSSVALAVVGLIAMCGYGVRHRRHG
jgi:hypothetical protein